MVVVVVRKIKIKRRTTRTDFRDMKKKLIEFGVESPIVLIKL